MRLEKFDNIFMKKRFRIWHDSDSGGLEVTELARQLLAMLYTWYHTVKDTHWQTHTDTYTDIYTDTHKHIQIHGDIHTSTDRYTQKYIYTHRHTLDKQWDTKRTRDELKLKKTSSFLKLIGSEIFVFFPFPFQGSLLQAGRSRIILCALKNSWHATILSWWWVNRVSHYSPKV